MPRATTRFAVRAFALAIACALPALIGLTPTTAGAATLAAPTSGSTSPSPTSSSSTGSSKNTKTPTVTFGVGPSNGKQLDGRPYFSYAASPGQVISDHFALVNISNQTLDLLVYGTTGLTNADGSLGYQPDAAKQTGAGAWLQTPLLDGKPIFAIKGRSTVTLPFKLDIPANASPGDHTAGIAVGLLANVVGGSTKNLHFEQRVVAKVYVRVSGTAVAKLQVSNVNASYDGSLNPFGTGDASVSYTVKNTGNVDLGAKQKVSISGLFGDTGSAAKAPPVLADLVPGSTTKVTVKFHGVLPEVLLNASVHLTPIALPGSVDGKLNGATGSAHLWAIPWAFIVLILLLVGVGYGTHRYRKHRLATRPAPSHRRAK